MADNEQLNRDVKNTVEDASHSFGQLKDDAVRVAQSAADIGRQGVDQVKAKLSDGTAAVKSKLEDGTAAVKARLNDGSAAVRSKLSDGSEAVRDAADRARERGSDLLEQTKEQIEQNPLQAIAIAAAVGVVVGVLLRR